MTAALATKPATSLAAQFEAEIAALKHAGTFRTSQYPRS